MIRTAWRRRGVQAVLGVVVGLLALLAGPATPASAHAALVTSSPQANDVLQDAPKQVVLTFTENVNPVAGKIKVIAPDGKRVDRNEARQSGDQLIIPLGDVTQIGTYLVSFRVISADSHPVGGAFSFSYKEVSPGGPPSDVGSNVGAPGVVQGLLPVARGAGYLGLILLVGSALVLTLLWPRRLDRGGPLKVAYLGAGLAALGTLFEMALDVPYVSGTLSGITGDDVREVLSSQYGAAHTTRLGVLAASVILVRAVARGRGTRADRALLAVLGVVGAATWSISGHPTATAVPTVSVAADMIHIASMSIWLGGLAMLVLFLLPRANATELSAIVPIWSRWAGYAVSALLLTGLAQALLQFGSIHALIATAYGWLLLAKVGLVGVVLAVAAFSRRMVAAFTPAGGSLPPHTEADADRAAQAEPEETNDETSDEAPEADPGPATRVAPRGPASRLRRLVLIEAIVALTVIGVTSVLVQLTPGRSAATSAPGLQSATLIDPGGKFVLSVDLSPARIGANDIHLYATTSDGRPQTVVEWNVTASNQAQGVEGVQAAILPITPDHAIGQITLPSAGTWRFTFTLRLDETTNGIVATDLAVSN